MELSRKDTMVVGLGESGLAVVRFLAERGARVVVNDRRDREALGAAATEAEALGAELVLGGHPDRAFDDLDLIVVSPGVPRLAQLDQAEQRGVPVVSEVELAARFIEAPIVAITGTNGKSTVTTLIGEMSRRLGRPVFVGGNLGRPMIEAAGTDAGAKGGLVVVELSSFQLERVSQMKAHVAVLLNITPDHLDRYPSFEATQPPKPVSSSGRMPRTSRFFRPTPPIFGTSSRTMARWFCSTVVLVMCVWSTVCSPIRRAASACRSMS